MDTVEEEKHLEVAKMLLESGSVLDRRSVQGDTALHKAVRRNFKMVMFLVESGNILE